MKTKCEKCKLVPVEMCYTIKGQHSEVVMCPNCMSESIYNRGVKWPIADSDKRSEISDKPDALSIIVPGYIKHIYVVTTDEAVRLLEHALMPDEYKALLKNHSETEYELHDDFYTEDGFALQPMDEDEYIHNLQVYAETASAKQKKKISNWIKELSEI